ncbi:MAG: DUF5682 family protein [Caldilineaceae bacterium]
MRHDNTYLLGIRHHGPGSAASVRKALQELQPDLILLEGPPEGEALLALAAQAEMQPPVAQLIYAVDDLSLTALYPFTVFSPEWQTIQYAAQHQTPLRFMDLPQTHHLALLQAAKTAASAAVANEPDPQPEYTLPTTASAPLDTQEPHLPSDPLQLLAQAAGFEDSERWWERLVEQRHEGLDLFTGIGEAMVALRDVIETEWGLSPREALREAWMRKSLRTAKAEGFARIAVVCGAWHVPALMREVQPKADNDLLKALPKCKVAATWIPWSYDRITFASGYGAGVQSPGWYHFLWESRAKGVGRATALAAQWLTTVAHLLRAEGLDVAAANVIEAVRLSEALAALRDKPLPGLPELQEAALATLCFGNTTMLGLIEKRLIIGERLGEVPPTTPMVPLQEDVVRWQRKLRLKPETTEKLSELDLRTPNGLEQSKLLHRLNLLGIGWGKLRSNAGGKGTFKETWQLQWQPEFVVRLIEASIWGNTVADAATGYVQNQLQQSTDLPQITQLIDQTLLADLPAAVQLAVQRLEAQAAVANDVVQLMGALPLLAHILRYGNVRGTDAPLLAHVLNGFVTRISIGLPSACFALDEDAAGAMLQRIEACHEALLMLQNEGYLALWWATVEKLATQSNLPSLLAGKCCRLLLAGEKIDPGEASRRLHLALSLANQPTDAAAWFEGMLRGSGLLLLHDAQLWAVVDDWLVGLNEATFLQLLPLLRRTFATFQVGERRQMGEKVKRGSEPRATATRPPDEPIDHIAAVAALPLVAQLLGLVYAA